MDYFISFIPQDAMDTFTKNSAARMEMREMEARKFYCLIGIMLACVAILLALGARPVGIYRSGSDAISAAMAHSTQATPTPDKRLALAKSE